MSTDTSQARDTAVPPIEAQRVTLEEGGDVPPGEALGLEGNPLHAVTVRLQACVGEVAMSVGQLLQARENALLEIDRTVEEPIDLLLNGRVVARGQLVAVEDRFAVRVTELPLPLGM